MQLYKKKLWMWIFQQQKYSKIKLPVQVLKHMPTLPNCMSTLPRNDVETIVNDTKLAKNHEKTIK